MVLKKAICGVGSTTFRFSWLANKGCLIFSKKLKIYFAVAGCVKVIPDCCGPIASSAPQSPSWVSPCPSSARPVACARPCLLALGQIRWWSYYISLIITQTHKYEAIWTLSSISNLKLNKKQKTVLINSY